MFIDNLIEALKSVFYNPFIFVPLLLYFILIASIDHKHFRIPNSLTLIIFLYGCVGFNFLNFSWVNIEGLVIGILLLLIPSIMKNFNMGGDVKTLGIIGFYLGTYGLIFFVSIFIAVLFFVFMFTKNKTPLGPYFLLSYLACGILTYFVF